MCTSTKPKTIEKIKLLITVKTYPQLSSKHKETVCTAGVREDGRWIRIYPICYRGLSKTGKYKKFQWIEVDLIKDSWDPRPESYRLAGEIKLLSHLDTLDHWRARKCSVLGKVYHSLNVLISEAYDVRVSTSLAVFKPVRIIGFKVMRNTISCNQRQKREMFQLQASQKSLERLVEDVPFKFFYTFEDCAGKQSTLQILDWEIYQLCHKFMKVHGANKQKILELLKELYFNRLAKERDIYLFLGTHKYWHIRRSKNPFMIVGVFYPPV